MLALTLALAVLAEPAPPAKIAVIALAAGDVSPQLADDMTELLAAEVARRGGMEIAGKEEFRARLGVTEDRRATSCLVEMPCLGRVGTELGVTRILSATIGRRGADHILAVNLIDLLSARTEGRVFKQVPGGLPPLIRELKEAVRRVFEPAPEPGTLRVTSAVEAVRVYLDDVFIGTTPLAKSDLLAGRHRLRAEREGRYRFARVIDVPAGETLELTLDPASLPERPRWPRYLGWGALGAAGAVALAGTLEAVLSQETPNEPVRKDNLAEVGRLEGRARNANILFLTAGALAVTSGVVLWVYRAEVFDLAELQVAAGPSGAQARLRW